MKQGIFITLILLLAFGIAYLIFTYMLPDYIRAGGPLVVLLITLSITIVTFIFERLFMLHLARGKGSLPKFVRSLKHDISEGRVDSAIELCDKQKGTLANVIRSGLARFVEVSRKNDGMKTKDMLDAVKRSIDDTMSLEIPLLEKNLVVLSTIASIATLVGLLGTTVGMIRAFRALAHAGAPDAIQLSVGISEALINTAGGLFCAIMGIVFYNIFATRIDNFTYMIDETSITIFDKLLK
ncbi:MotA/TolQ/ExbB proton channel family protein [bacterium]|nr:MotA/TolQ/ExbB proton channel family protein [bacterium]